nr:MAG TPA: hypothetical protein [Caudoviricetes sp.]
MNFTTPLAFSRSFPPCIQFVSSSIVIYYL